MGDGIYFLVGRLFGSLNSETACISKEFTCLGADILLLDALGIGGGLDVGDLGLAPPSTSVSESERSEIGSSMLQWYSVPLLLFAQILLISFCFTTFKTPNLSFQLLLIATIGMKLSLVIS